MINKKILLTTLFLSLFCFLPFKVLAAPTVVVKDPTYSAKFVSQSEKDPIVIEVGAEKTVTIKFKNIGKATWNGSGSRYISAYTMEPRERKSVFVSDNWISAKQTAKMLGTVKPNETGELKITLKAPTKLGEYTEKFYLAAENYSWVKGGYFFLKIKVIKSENKIPTATEEENTNKKSNLFSYNLNKVEVNGGDKINLVTIWQNVGEIDWSNIYLVDADTTGTKKSLFFDNSWAEVNKPIFVNEVISAGKIKRIEFVIKAPSKKGQYSGRFKLMSEGKILNGSTFNINLNVLSDDPNASAETIEVTPRLSEEPVIRVGIWKPEKAVKFSSLEDDYNVLDGELFVGVLPKGKTAELSYESGVYSISFNGDTYTSSNYWRLSPVFNRRAIFTLENFAHYVNWKGPRNFNQYRGSMEYRLSEKGTMYVINETLFEDYVAGIGETSSVAPMEYIKALLTAARSYAYYIKEHTDKHASRFFDVVATTGDQLYLGYISEELMPRVVEAQRATRGMMVTYNGDIVITPYFGNSNGKTKSWTAVWGGTNKPWLVPVVANYDVGRSMFGHGVGMSQRDCAERADAEGLDYVDLVKYYYTGVEVEKIYN